MMAIFLESDTAAKGRIALSWIYGYTWAKAWDHNYVLAAPALTCAVKYLTVDATFQRCIHLH